jgi:catechol 2,3-dioxygenase
VTALVSRKTKPGLTGRLPKSLKFDMMTAMKKDKSSNPYKAPAQTRIGHVHLKVSDLDRALGFYRDILGFEVNTMYGEQAAFLSAGGYHHHIGLNTWHSKGAAPASREGVGLYHVAILYPERRDLAAVLQRLIDAGSRIDGASDHGVSEAIYLRDPDNNGIELYWDRPREEWPQRQNGELDMYTRPLDVQSLLSTLIN